jgi:GntR family transcriptional regulator
LAARFGAQAMKIVWNEKDPIYQQIHQYLAQLILDGVIDEGAALPSVRQLAVEQHVNPITVSKAISMLVDDGIALKRRGLGMFVADGAAEQLKIQMRARFLSEEWPSIHHRIGLLGLSLTELLKEKS